MIWQRTVTLVPFLTPISIFLLRNDKILAYLGEVTRMPRFTNIFFHRFTQFQPSQASSAGVASGFRRRSITFPYQYCLVLTFSYMIGHKSIAKTQITKQNLYAGQISWAHAIPCPTFAMFREIFTSTWDLGGLFPSQIGQRLLHQGDRSSLRGQKSEDHRGDAVAGLWQKRALPRLLRL